MKLEDLELGKIYVTGDSYGYFLVKITKTVHPNEEYGPDWIQVGCQGVANGEICHLGYNKKYSAYKPQFFTVSHFLSNYPPEYREEMLKEIGL